MTMATIEPAQPPANRGGRPKGSKGNGKLLEDRLARIDRRKQTGLAEIEESRAIAQARLEQQAEKARADLAVQISERATRQANRVIEKYEQQEAARSPQFQIDTRVTLGILVSLAVITFITTAMLTADGTIGAAAAARFAIDWFGFVLFGVFEVATLAFMLMYYVRGSRIDIITGDRIPASQWFVAMLFASGLTVALSTYHVLDLYDYDWGSIEMWVGIGIRVTASLFFVLISKGIAGVLFAKALDLHQVARIGQVQEINR